MAGLIYIGQSAPELYEIRFQRTSQPILRSYAYIWAYTCTVIALWYTTLYGPALRAISSNET